MSAFTWFIKAAKVAEEHYLKPLQGQRFVWLRTASGRPQVPVSRKRTLSQCKQQILGITRVIGLYFFLKKWMNMKDLFIFCLGCQQSQVRYFMSFCYSHPKRFTITELAWFHLKLSIHNILLLSWKYESNVSSIVPQVLPISHVSVTSQCMQQDDMLPLLSLSFPLQSPVDRILFKIFSSLVPLISHGNVLPKSSPCTR